MSRLLIHPTDLSYTASQLSDKQEFYGRSHPMLDRTQLLPLLEAYVAGEIPLYELHARFYSGHIRLNDTMVTGLYQGVSMHLAMYTAGDWPQQTLKEAIGWQLALYRGDDNLGLPPMIDQQWSDIMESGMAPWPLTLVVRD